MVSAKSPLLVFVSMSFTPKVPFYLLGKVVNGALSADFVTMGSMGTGVTLYKEIFPVLLSFSSIVLIFTLLVKLFSLLFAVDTSLP